MTSAWMSEREHDGYYLGTDNVGQNVRHLGPCPWEAVPIGLNTAFDVDEIVHGANAGLNRHHIKSKVGATDASSANEGLLTENEKHKYLDVVAHFEAGPAGCGFAYHESMANCFEQGRKRDVLFCYVPRETDQDSLARARDAILAIIGATVGELIERRTTEPQDVTIQFGDVKG